MTEKNICYRQQRKKEVVYDDCIPKESLSQRDWHDEEDLNKCIGEIRTSRREVEITKEKFYSNLPSTELEDLANRSYSTLDGAKLQEQAGFRQWFSYVDHIQTVLNGMKFAGNTAYPLF
ncbi:hypothetical protein RB195_025389 [Necator americanus]|uniref:Uncharacterized protein n=1 Tax=Necator americanus TaxID=51031 RepID=A0ABR1ESQ0_NECAM